MTTEDRRAYQRKYMKELRDWRKAHHCCTSCGKKDAYTICGRRLCFECNEKSKVYGIRYERKRGRKPFKPNPPPPTKSELLGIAKEDWKDNGLCIRCGDPLDGAMVAWDVHGKKSVLCTKCYKKTVDAAGKARAARAKKHGRYLAPPYAKTKKAIDTYRELQAKNKAERGIA